MQNRHSLPVFHIYIMLLSCYVIIDSQPSLFIYLFIGVFIYLYIMNEPTPQSYFYDPF